MHLINVVKVTVSVITVVFPTGVSLDCGLWFGQKGALPLRCCYGFCSCCITRRNSNFINLVALCTECFPLPWGKCKNANIVSVLKLRPPAALPRFLKAMSHSVLAVYVGGYLLLRNLICVGGKGLFVCTVILPEPVFKLTLYFVLFTTDVSGACNSRLPVFYGSSEKEH
jgi:hypothetical protein